MKVFEVLRFALLRAPAMAGIKRPAITAIIEMPIKSSTRVNAFFFFIIGFL